MKKCDEQNERKRKRICPYCDEELLEADLPYCKPCGVTLRYCAKCDTVVAREAEVCPHCGGKLEWK